MILTAVFVALAHSSCSDPLYEAAERGDLAAVMAAHADGADLDQLHRRRIELTVFSETALYVASREGHTPVVRYLLDAGADPNVRCNGESTALSIAAVRNSGLGMLQLLVDAGADLIGPAPKFRPVLASCAVGGDYESFRFLLERSRLAGVTREQERTVLEPLEERHDDLRHVFEQVLLWDRDPPSPLHAAVVARNTEEVERLLAEGTNASVADSTGWTALHWASGYEGSSDLVRVLLDAGADPSAATHGGFTPLMAAAQAADPVRVLQLLDAGAIVDAVDEDHCTALHVATWRAGTDVITALVERDADPTIRDRWTRTAPEVSQWRRDNLGVDVTAAFENLPAKWWPTSVDQIRMLTPDDDQAAPVLRFTVCEVTESRGAHRLGATIWLMSACPYGQAYDVFWQVGDEATRIGELVAKIGAVRAFMFEGHSSASPGDEVVLVLRPNPSLALEQLRTWEIWGAEVSLTARPK